MSQNLILSSVFVEIYSTIMSFASLIVGCVITCWIYFQTNQYIRRREAREAFGALCEHIASFKCLLGQFGQTDIWINKAAIETYLYHSTITRCVDVRKETIQDNPFLKLYICCGCFLKESKKQRKDIKTPNLEDLNKLSAELSKLLCADMWYEIKETNVWESMSEDMQNWLVVKYPKISRKVKLDKDDVHIICRDVVANIIPQAKSQWLKMNELWPLNLKSVMWVTLGLFLISFVGPSIIKCLEYDSIWMCLGIVSATVVLAICIACLLVRMFMREAK